MSKKRIGSMLLLMCLLVSCCTFYACTEEPDLPPEAAFYETKFQSTEASYHAYGKYVYVCIQGELYRYDNETFECLLACADPECDGTGVIHEIRWISALHNGKLYFKTEAKDIEYDEYGRPVNGVDRHHYAYLDLHTGEVVVLRTLLGHEDIAGSKAICFDDSYMYYMVNLLKEGGNPLLAIDYIPTYCRLSLTGLKEEVLFPAQEGSVEGPLGIWDGELIVTRDDVISAYNLETGAFREIFNYENSEFLMKPHNFTIGYGKVYFFGKVKNFRLVNGLNVANPALVELDLKTGEYRKLIDELVHSYYVDESGIYYYKKENRQIPCPEITDETIVINSQSSAEMYYCDLNGENERVLNRNEELYMLYPNFLVVNGYAYGQYMDPGGVKRVEVYEGVWQYAKGTHFRKIELATGKIVIPDEDEG